MLVPSCSRVAEDGMVVTTAASVPAPPASSCSSCWARRSTCRARPHVAAWNEEYGADPSRFGAPAAGRRRGAAGVGRVSTTATGGDVRDGRPGGQGRQRPVRTGLRQVHPLLQVRRRVRGAVAEHVRHRRRRPRVRRAHLDGVGRGADRLRLRVLRQLHRGLPDRRADARSEHEMRAAGTWDESRQTRDRPPCAPTAASAAT